MLRAGSANYAGTSLYSADPVGCSGIENDGAQGRDRTTDTAIFSRMLYQLSYLGILASPEAGRAGGL
jgi:hypothetical protein